MTLSYDICVYILYDHPVIYFKDSLGSPYRDLVEIILKLLSHHAVVV